VQVNGREGEVTEATPTTMLPTISAATGDEYIIMRHGAEIVVKPQRWATASFIVVAPGENETTFTSLSDAESYAAHCRYERIRKGERP
jgi:hypothetical protein